MMKKRTGLSFCVTIIFLLGVSACSDKKKDVSIEHERVIWHETREKPFGRFDYPKISREEGISLLKDKFKVKVPDMISQAESLMDKEVVTAEVKADKPEYTIFAEGDELRIHGYYPFMKEDQLEMTVVVEFTYLFTREEKEVRLRTQGIYIVNVGENAEFPKENGHRLLEQTADFIDLPKSVSNRSIENFEEKYQEPDNRPAGQGVKLFSNDEEMTEKKKVSQSIVVEFNEQKEIRKIQAAIVDYTE